MGFSEGVDGDMFGEGELSKEVDEEESMVKMRLKGLGLDMVSRVV